MNFVNLTPHTVRVADAQDQIILTVDPSGDRATVRTSPQVVRHIDGVPMSMTQYGPVSGLPDPKTDTLYIVSTMIFAHPDVQDRVDLIVPDSGPDCIRKDGQPYAVRRFTVRQ
jgi:hypothetical protein